MIPGRVLAVDPGKARIGLALSDETRTIVGRAWTLSVKGRLDRAIHEIGRVIREEEVTELVVGLPRNMDGTEGAQARWSRELGARLGEVSGLQPVFVDERLTTFGAHQILDQVGRRGRARRRLVDAVAASVILEDHLSETAGGKA